MEFALGPGLTVPIRCTIGPHAGQWRFAGYLYLSSAERRNLGDRPSATDAVGLAELIAAATPDEIMAGLRQLDGARFDEVRDRIGRLADLDYEGSPESLAALHPADREAIQARETPPS